VRQAIWAEAQENQGEKNRNPGPMPEKDNFTKRKRDKCGDKKGKTSTSCFNCRKEGHITHNCT